VLVFAIALLMQEALSEKGPFWSGFIPVSLAFASVVVVFLAVTLSGRSVS